MSDNGSQCQGTYNTYKCSKMSSPKNIKLFFKVCSGWGMNPEYFCFPIIFKHSTTELQSPQSQRTSIAYESTKISFTKCKNLFFIMSAKAGPWCQPDKDKELRAGCKRPLGLAPGFITNIRLGWKWLTVTNLFFYLVSQGRAFHSRLRA